MLKSHSSERWHVLDTLVSWFEQIQILNRTVSGVRRSKRSQLQMFYGNLSAFVWNINVCYKVYFGNKLACCQIMECAIWAWSSMSCNCLESGGVHIVLQDPRMEYTIVDISENNCKCIVTYPFVWTRQITWFLWPQMSQDTCSMIRVKNKNGIIEFWQVL